MLRRAGLLPLVAALAAACGAPPRPAAPAPPAAPRLVVLVVVDQWPTWQFERDRGRYRGGLRRLLDAGRVWPAMALPHANTYTAPGHATLGTGVAPRLHGVVGNAWYRREALGERPAEDNPASPVLRVGGGLLDGRGASGAALRVGGPADALHAATAGRGRVVTLALKARSACLVAGRRPDLAVFYEAAAGGLTTSRAYAAELPPWLVAFDRAHPPEAAASAVWEATDPAGLAAATGLPDDAPGEGGEHGVGAGFPHRPADGDDPAGAYLATPMADELVLAAAAAAVDGERLGADDAPDLLAISLGSHDFAGHAWGQDSWEVLDLTLRLDRALGELLGVLDARVGRDRYAVVLTSDHGATPLVERARVPGTRRIPPAELAAAAERGLAEALGAGPWVARVSSQGVYLTPAWAAVDPARRGPALEAAAAALRAVPGIAAAVRADQAGGDCGLRAGLDRALCESVVPGASGELLVVPAQGSVVSAQPRGTQHDAPFDDNRRVPLVVVAPGVAPGEARGPASSLQVAPTVAALLGAAPPEGATQPSVLAR